MLPDNIRQLSRLGFLILHGSPLQLRGRAQTVGGILYSSVLTPQYAHVVYGLDLTTIIDVDGVGQRQVTD